MVVEKDIVVWICFFVLFVVGCFGCDIDFMVCEIEWLEGLDIEDVC